MTIMLLKRITLVWILIAAFCKIDPGQASVLHQKPAVLSVKAGEAVTLRCSFEEQKMNEKMVWYKQKPGQAPQNVGSLIANIKIISPEFEKSGIKLERTSNSISLIIPNTAKHDEGTYFCGISLINTVQFSTGTFLTVTDDSQPNILVLQTPVSSSVPSGEAVNLQCTVLSEIRSAELRVFWFRSAAGSSFPEIIFTHHNNSSSSNNSSRQCEINSVYNFSKIIGNDNNTGIFYCAVQTCGRIIIGNGTTVNLVWPLDPVVMCLGAAVGVCVVVISVQAAINRKKKICEHCSAEKLQHGLFKEKTANQEQDAEELNYAALNFSERKTKRTRKLKKEKSEDMLYSTVRCSSVNDRRTDH